MKHPQLKKKLYYLQFPSPFYYSPTVSSKVSQSVQGGPQKPVVSRGWKNHSKTNFLKPFIGGHIYIYITPNL